MGVGEFKSAPISIPSSRTTRSNSRRPNKGGSLLFRTARVSRVEPQPSADGESTIPPKSFLDTLVRKREPFIDVWPGPTFPPIGGGGSGTPEPPDNDDGHGQVDPPVEPIVPPGEPSVDLGDLVIHPRPTSFLQRTANSIFEVGIGTLTWLYQTLLMFFTFHQSAAEKRLYNLEATLTDLFDNQKSFLYTMRDKQDATIEELVALGQVISRQTDVLGEMLGTIANKISFSNTLLRDIKQNTAADIIVPIPTME